MTREKIFTVTIDDCTVQHYRASGAGGQKRNKTSSATRVVHEPSGARGECSEHREQARNKREAFVRMVNTPIFRAWLAAKTHGLKTPKEIEAEVDADLADPTKTITEIRVKKDEWKKVNPKDLT